MLRKAFYVMLATFLACILLIQIYGIFDLETYEYRYIISLLGWYGVVLILFINSGFVYFLLKIILSKKRTCKAALYVRNLFIGAWVLAFAWMLDWTFLETPVSVHIPEMSGSDYDDLGGEKLSTPPSPDNGYLVGSNKLTADQELKLGIMYARIEFNNPEVYQNFNIDQTIEKYTQKYDIDPKIIFFLLYVDSFYGEAVSGRLPYFKGMTSETFRDFIQVHLPTWFVESDLRQEIVKDDILVDIFGSRLGFKLRYAIQKATLDVSLQPYAISIFTDIFLVLKEYEKEFPEIFEVSETDTLESELADSFLKIKETALLVPYEEPYNHDVYGSEYYDEYRKDLKRFAKAVFYKTIFDFDFATKIQVLLVRYHTSYFKDALGEDIWQKIPLNQRLVMLAMLRDLYVPNVGKPAYSKYALPELNCLPVAFVAEEAATEIDLILVSDGIWKPKESRKLWSGAGSRLNIFNEVWEVVTGDPMPGLGGAGTINEARKILKLRGQ